MDKNLIISEARTKLGDDYMRAALSYFVIFALFFNTCLILFLIIPWVQLAGIYLVIFIPYIAIMFLVESALLGPYRYGMVMFYSKLYKMRPATGWEFQEGFQKQNFFKTVELKILRSLLVFVWSLLLIVPGVIVGISYSMSDIIFRANPRLTSIEVLKKSKEMMRGHKKEFFMLCVKLMPYYLIGIVTFGLGLVWFAPLANMIKMVYYKRVLQEDVGFIPESSETGITRQTDSHDDGFVTKPRASQTVSETINNTSTVEIESSNSINPLDDYANMESGPVFSFDEVFKPEPDFDFNSPPISFDAEPVPSAVAHAEPAIDSELVVPEAVNIIPEPVVAPEPAIAAESQPVVAPEPAIASEPVAEASPIIEPKPIVVPEPPVEPKLSGESQNTVQAGQVHDSRSDINKRLEEIRARVRANQDKK